jgi:hypothetical protein
MRRFKSYVGLTSAMKKLESIANNHNFVSLYNAANKIDWNTVPVLKTHDLKNTINRN